MITKLQQALENFMKAGQEFDNEARVAASDCNSKLKLAESRKMRDYALDVQILGARAERRILEIPIV